MLRFQFNQELEELRKQNRALKEKITKREQPAEPLGPSEPIAPGSKELPAYREALLEVRKENWNQAILYMEGFAQRFPKSHLADNAIFWIAEIYRHKNEPRLAQVELERLLNQYPSSDRAGLAIKRLERLRP